MRPTSLEEQRSARFNDLPVELLVDILKDCPDFTCLWDLVSTSRKLHSVFVLAGPEIVRSVLDSTPCQLRILMQLVLQMRSGALEQQVISDILKPHFPVPQHMPPTHIPRMPQFPLAEDLPTIDPTTEGVHLLALVKLARDIHVLAHDCLQQYIERSMATDLCTQAHPEGVHFRPTAVEEYRMMQAFWLVQFFFEIKIAAKKNAITWTSEEERQIVHSITLESFYSVRVNAVNSAMDFVRRHKQYNASHPFQLPIPTVQLHGGPGWSCAPLPKIQENSEDLATIPIGARILESFNMHNTFGGGIFDAIVTSKFERYGVMIWELDSMIKLGLFTKQTYQPMHGYNGDCNIKWRCLLSKEELDAAFRRKKTGAAAWSLFGTVDDTCGCSDPGMKSPMVCSAY